MQFDDLYVEKVYAGWLGKCIGVRYGAPVEMWTADEIARKYAGKIGYFEDYDVFAADDDTNGPIFFFRGFLDEGERASSEAFGRAWRNYAPYRHGFYWWGGYGVSTEHTAYENMINGILPPRSGSAAQNGAEIAEQIGGQIFSDIWGLLHPGDEATAAALSEQAARVSHDLSGADGGRFVAAMIAAAFDAKSVEEIVDRALAVIPAAGAYARAVADTVAFCRAHTAEESFRYISDTYSKARYPGNCHIIPNAAIIVYALLHGAGDFDRTLELVNFAGFDTDCNAGNAGTVMGVFCGLTAIDFDRWRAPVNDLTVCSSVLGCENVVDNAVLARQIAACGCRLHDVDYQGRYTLENPGIDFLLPGSTHGLIVENGKGRNDGHGFAVVGDGGECRIVKRTYYGKKELADNRYDPCTSPVVVPGQRIAAVFEGTARVYYRDYFTGKRVYSLPATGCAALTIADRSAFVGEIGLAFEGSKCTLKTLEVSGDPDFVFDPARLSNEAYALEHVEISGCTYHRGIWRVEDGSFSGRDCATGQLFTGVRMTDVVVRCAVETVSGGAGVLARVQGAARGYAAVVENGRLLLCKNEYGWRTLCESAPGSVPSGALELILAARGDTITASAGAITLCFTDPDPIPDGVVGLTVRRGAARFGTMDIKANKQ